MAKQLKRVYPGQVVIDTEKLPPKGSEGIKRKEATWDASKPLVSRPKVKSLKDIMDSGI
jgi:hypothetical protein